MKYPKLHKFDKMNTPPVALDYIEKYLDKSLVYWEFCYGDGFLAKELTKRGFKVVGNKNIDSLKEEIKCDFILTNVPFSNNKDFIERAIKLNKPFALLIRLEHLGGVRAFNLLKGLDFQIIIPKKRINYITPKMLKGEKVGGSPFHSIWITKGLKLPKQINYENELLEEKE